MIATLRTYARIATLSLPFKWYVHNYTLTSMICTDTYTDARTYRTPMEEWENSPNSTTGYLPEPTKVEPHAHADKSSHWRGYQPQYQ